MKAIEFQKLLFQTAVSVMAVDGEIHTTEIEEIKFIVKNTAYFLDFEFEKHLEETIFKIKQNGKKAINLHLDSLSTADLNESQELIIIEVIIRIIEADKNIAASEIQFLQLVKSKFKVSDETVLATFPKQIEYLIDYNNFGASSSFDTELKFI